LTERLTIPGSPDGGTHIGTAHYSLLLLMGILWGLALSLAKIGVQAGGHPVGMALWQVVTSSSLMLVLLFLKGRRPVFRGDIARFGLICGSCGVAFPAIALFWCALYLPAGVVAIAFASMPLFTYLLSALLKIEPARKRRLSIKGDGGIILSKKSLRPLFPTSPFSRGGDRGQWVLHYFARATAAWTGCVGGDGIGAG
jgi:hypothetical protein